MAQIFRTATPEDIARANANPFGAKGVFPGQPVLDPFAPTTSYLGALPIAQDPTQVLQNMANRTPWDTTSDPTKSAPVNFFENLGGHIANTVTGRTLPIPEVVGMAKTALSPVTSFVGNFTDWTNKPQGEYEADKNAAKAGLKVQAAPPQGAPGFSPTGENSFAVQAAQAAQETGTDPNLLFRIASKESGGNLTAKNPNSSALGPYQFTKQTWLGTVKNSGGRYGLGDMADSIVKKNGVWTVSDPKAEAIILGLRTDPKISSQMAGELIQANARQLHQTFGRPASPEEIYLAHVFGPMGAIAFTKADQNLPAKNLAAAETVSANRTLFFDEKGTPRTVAQLRAKLDKAGGSGLSVPGVPGAQGAAQGGDLLGSITQNFSAPPEEPLPVARNFAETDRLLAEMAPKAVDQKALQQEQFLNLLAGFSQGLGRGGSLAEMLGGVAQGTTGAAAGNAAQRRQLQQQFDQAQQRYTGQQFDYAGAKDNARVDDANATAKAGFANKKARWAWDTGLQEKANVDIGPAGTLTKTTVDPATGKVVTSVFDVAGSMDAVRKYQGAAGSAFGTTGASANGLPADVKKRVESFNLAVQLQSDLGAYTQIADEVLSSPHVADILGPKGLAAAQTKAATDSGGDSDRAKNILIGIIAKELSDQARTNPAGLQTDFNSWAKMGLITPRLALNGTAR